MTLLTKKKFKFDFARAALRAALAPLEISKQSSEEGEILGCLLSSSALTNVTIKVCVGMTSGRLAFLKMFEDGLRYFF